MDEKKYYRREFIKLFSLGTAGVLLYNCTSSEKKDISVDPVSNKSHKDSINDIVREFIDNDVTFLTSEKADFETYNQGFNKRISKSPKVIAVCKNNEGVQKAVKLAIKQQLKIVIKSGGHSFEGFSSNDGGLVINLSLMKNISWLENERVSIEPGVKLGQLYDEILPKKRIIPAGSCEGVGVGGLTLGGGYGFFSRKYGLTCDSLEALTFINAKGEKEIIKGDNELLWACKGGGNGNFGIITEMTFKTHPAPDYFQSHRFKAYKLDIPRAKSLLKEWFTLSKNLPEHSFSAFVLNGKTLTVLLTNYEEPDEHFNQFISQFEPLADKYSKGSKKELATALKTFYGISDPIYFKNASAGMYKSFDDIESSLDEVIEKVIANRGFIYQVNTLGGKINDADFQSKSAFPHRDYPYLSELQSYWNEGDNEAHFLTVFEEIQQVFAKNGITAHYRNYPDINFKNFQNSYYGENHNRLKEIKVKYDPSNLFEYEQGV